MRHLVINLPTLQNRWRGVRNLLCYSRSSPLLRKVARVRFATWNKTGFDCGPTRYGVRKFLPAVFIKLAKSVLNIHGADTCV